MATARADTESENVEFDVNGDSVPDSAPDSAPAPPPYEPPPESNEEVEHRREAELAEAHRNRDTPRYRSLVIAWMRQWLRRPERPATEPLPDVGHDQVAITYAGHACNLIRYRNLSIVTDPMLGGRVGMVRRQIAPGISPADLQDINLVLISHAHADHLHLPTLAKLPRSATIIVPPRTAKHVSELGFARVVELDVGQSLQHRGVDLATTAVRHSARRDERAVAYMLRGDGPSVFFCGDSGYFSGFAEVGRRYRPDIALLPIGGYWPRSFRDQHMSPMDALYAFEDLQARILIPIHHGVFTLSYELRDDPERWLAELVRARDLAPHVLPLVPGMSRVFTAER